ncbi:Peptidase S12 Pab87-related C-terminal [Fusarium albosuccineum]|uniref:Peptidase S12 Pab87-related C-terminal n=1 Tax=Fusarium albosuccineum TaxID=1237068 RepID=A0A8H4L4K1_9HYPO|nr:Peptidase S12 Pab87-related C-terminal [Fusarium albosuccineum]
MTSRFSQILSLFSDPHETTSAEGRLGKTDGAVGQICTISGVPGASIGVIHNGKTIHTYNYGKGDLEGDIPMTSDTVLGLGSITKSFVSAGISNLVAENKVTWNTPVKKVLPEFQQINSVVEENLTISDILSHRSGLAGFGDMNMAFQGDGDMMLDKSSLFQLVKHFPAQFPFRSDWGYFVWGYALAGKVIERLSGMELNDYIQKTLLQPLGLNATAFDPDSVDQCKFAKPYAGLSDGTAFPLPKLQEFKGTFFEASGGLYSSLNDMIGWSKEMLKAIKSEESVIKDAVSIVSNHVPIENPSLRERSYGYGWIRTQLPGVVGIIGDNVDLYRGIQYHPPLGSSKDEPRLMLYHQGSTVGYYTFLALFPESDSAVIVLTNSIALSDAADWIARILIKALFDLQDDKDYVALARKVNDKAIEDYKTLADTIEATRALPEFKNPSFFIGIYKSPSKPFRIDILPDPVNEGGLVFRFQGLKDQTYQLRHLCENKFEWALTHDESKRRGRYHNAELESYVFEFVLEEETESISLFWASNPLLPEYREVFSRAIE